MIKGFTFVVILAMTTFCLMNPLAQAAVDKAQQSQAEAAVQRGIKFLRSTQENDGSWAPEPGPAVTAMVLTVLLDRQEIPESDPAVQKALDFVLSKCRPDGGIHDGFLENYNTAISIAALARSSRPEANDAVLRGQEYLARLQWIDQLDPQDNPVDPEHPFYGGAGYGKHGRPDLSNTQVMLEGLWESGYDCYDPVFQRALVFVTRCQGTQANTQFGHLIVPDGGFVYSTSTDRDHIGNPESKAGVVVEETEDGPVSRLRTYGSMTYAGFKSYLYADLDRDDPRVTDALKWIKRHYTIERNPGMPEPQKHQGLYYYYMTFARALQAWGEPIIETVDGQKHRWADDLIDQIVKLQGNDGSWVNEADRWMEGRPELTTAYALIALSHATAIAPAAP